MADDDTRERWNRRYEGGDCPWDDQGPSKNLVDTLDRLGLRAGRALELGCGLGRSAIWLARQGWDVVAADVSSRAIELAREKAAAQGFVAVADGGEETSESLLRAPAPPGGRESGEAARGRLRFVVRDVTRSFAALGGPFDLVFDRGCFHSVEAGDRSVLARHVAEVLGPEGWWLSVVGSVDVHDGHEGGPPRLRAAEIAAAIEPWVEIEELSRSRFYRTDSPGGRAAWRVVARRRREPAAGNPVKG